GLGGEAPTEQTPAGGICRVRLFVCMDGAARIGAPAQSVTTGLDRLQLAAHRTAGAGRRLRPSTRARAVRWCSSTPSLWNPPYFAVERHSHRPNEGGRCYDASHGRPGDAGTP